MENKEIDRIAEFLARHEATTETISKARLNQLIHVDTAIQKRTTEILSAQETIRNNSINISSISEDTGIARKTFYNNELLKLYVEEYEHVGKPSQDSTSEIQRLKEKNAELEQQIRLFLLRDIEAEDLKLEIDNLRKELNNYQTLIKNLEKQHAKQQREIERMQNPKNKVITLRRPGS